MKIHGAPTTILVYRVSRDRVDRVAFKTYVKNVLPNEWISSWPSASLGAGAMAVKSYGWYWALHSTWTTPSGALLRRPRRPAQPGVQAVVRDVVDERRGGPHMGVNCRIVWFWPTLREAEAAARSFDPGVLLGVVAGLVDSDVCQAARSTAAA